jgi:hypothetical protein
MRNMLERYELKLRKSLRAENPIQIQSLQRPCSVFLIEENLMATLAARNFQKS